MSARGWLHWAELEDASDGTGTGTFSDDEGRDDARWHHEPPDPPDPSDYADLPGDWLWTVERRPA